MMNEEDRGSGGAGGRQAAGWRKVVILVGALLCVPLAGWLPVDELRHAGAGLDGDRVGLGLGIFLCVGLLWVSEAVPLAATAMLVPVLGVVTGLSEMKPALAGFADPLIFLFLGGFAVAAAMSAQGIDRWLARRILRAGGGDFVKSACLLFGVTALLSMWMSNTATTAMMIPLVLGMLGHLPEEERTAQRAAFLLLGTAYAASVGGLGTLVGTPPNGIAAAQLGIGFAGWLGFGLPAMFLLLPLVFLVLWRVFRPGRVRFELMDHAGAFVWTRGRLATMAVFLVTAAAWMGGGWLGKVLGVGQAFDSVVAMVAAVVLLAGGVVSWKEIERRTEWGVLLLFGGGIVLSQLLDRSGAALFLAREIVLLTGDWPAVVLIAVSLGFVILLGEFASNTATAALLVPIFHSVALEAGLAPAKLVVPIALAASCGFMLPVATPPNAMVFATGLIRQRDMVRAGLLLDGVSLVALLGLAWWVFR